VVALAATWFVPAIKVIVPSANGGLAPLYSALLPGYGESLFEIAWNIVTHPGQVIQQAASGGPDGPRTYYWELLAPLAFLPVARSSS
jgi:hypothetical protein